MIDKIKCPSCGNQFDVEEALSGKLEAHFQAEYEKKVARQAEIFKADRAKLETEIDEFEKKKEKENELFEDKLNQRLTKESEKIQKQTLDIFELKLKSLEENIQLKSLLHSFHRLFDLKFFLPFLQQFWRVQCSNNRKL